MKMQSTSKTRMPHQGRTRFVRHHSKSPWWVRNTISPISTLYNYTTPNSQKSIVASIKISFLVNISQHFNLLQYISTFQRFIIDY